MSNGDCMMISQKHEVKPDLKIPSKNTGIIKKKKERKKLQQNKTHEIRNKNLRYVKLLHNSNGQQV